jgi:CheY-like chemotaxis protein
MSLLILVVDDEPDVEALFRQQFRRDIRDGRFTMDFAQSADSALKLISDAASALLILILSDINMPGMTGLELLYSAASGDTRAAVEWNKMRTRFAGEYVDEQMSLVAQIMESDKIVRHCPEDVTDRFLEILNNLKSMLGPGYSYR